MSGIISEAQFSEFIWLILSKNSKSVYNRLYKNAFVNNVTWLLLKSWSRNIGDKEPDL